TTADLAFALLLAAARRVVEGDSYVRRGQWRTWGPEILLGPDVHSATLGIVGLGRIGLAMAKRARGFNMRVIYYSRTPKPEAEKRLRLQYRPLEQLLVEADFVSLHAPLTEETYHLLGEAELARMKPGAILINTARGGLVDSRALYHALKEQRLAAAALDVTEEEPIDMGDPLLTLPNLVITPHIGSASIATRARMAELAVKNLLMALNGRIPRNAVNPEIAPAWRQARRLRLQGA
ncbi:MAG TPA: D-glycerate dehydrogenase, partial [Dehalococcoidia bacterium]|nr:D-glycerate dehydrogenase [Dehalococcoidia bacterium]